MNWQRVVLATGLIGFATAGCNRAPVTPPPVAASQSPKPQAVAAASTTAPEVSADGAPTDNTPPAGTDGVVAGDSASKPDEDDEGVPAEQSAECEPATPERIAVLAPGGPILIDVVFMLDGRPYTATFNENIDQVLAAADTNKDGRSTWTELAANEKYLASSQLNGQPISPRQLKMLIEQYDENRDGTVQSDEAARWLGRDMGAAVRAFTLRSSRWYHTNPRASSRVWQLLDSNRDARLTADEMSTAADKFLLFDADDDRVIAPAELASLREQLDATNPQAMADSRDVTRFGAIHVDETVAADRLEYLLSDLYASRQTLGPGSFRELPQLFARLDANSDQWLEQAELADLRTIDPHLRLTVAFTPGEEEAAVAALKLDSHAPDVTVVSQAANRMVLAVGKTRLIVSAQDLAPSGATAQPVVRSHVSAMVHDQCDAVFEDLDANADGRLGEREISSCAVNLSKQDANADGELSTDELSHCMIVAFLRGERPNEDSFYIPASSGAGSRNEQAAKWFGRADFNQDGDISRREFLGSLEQFKRLDGDQNGYLSADEAAD